MATAARGGRAARAAGSARRLLVMGALTRGRGARGGRDASADVVAWTRGGGRGGAARAREARHRDGPAGHEGPRAGAAAGGAAERGGADDPLRHRRRARRRPLPGAARARSGSSWRRSGATTSRFTRPTAPRRCATRSRHFDMVRCGVAIYGLDPFQSDPADHGLEPALALRSWVAALRRLDAGRERGLRPPLDARTSPPGSRPCRSATATAGGGRSRTTRTC